MPSDVGILYMTNSIKIDELRNSLHEYQDVCTKAMNKMPHIDVGGDEDKRVSVQLGLAQMNSAIAQYLTIVDSYENSIEKFASDLSRQESFNASLEEFSGELQKFKDIVFAIKDLIPDLDE